MENLGNRMYANLKEASEIANNLLSDLNEGRLSVIVIEEVEKRCRGYENFDWLVNKVLTLMAMK